MKVCTKCNIEKNLKDFSIHTGSGNYRNICRKCSYLKRKSVIRKKVTITSYKCDSCKIEKTLNFYHKSRITPQGIAHICKECVKIKTTKHYQKNKERIKKRTTKYYYNNKPKIRENNRNYQKKMMESDIYFKLTRRLRNRLYYALRNTIWKKNSNFTKYIGCDRDVLISHLESQFTDGMSWDNYGDWHIDHKTPLSSAISEETLYELCHYTNLQPLWALDNIKKGNK